MKTYWFNFIPIISSIVTSLAAMESTSTPSSLPDIFWGVELAGEEMINYKRGELISTFDDHGCRILDSKSFLKLFPHTKTFAMNIIRLPTMNSLDYYADETLQFSYNRYNDIDSQGMMKYSIMPTIAYLTLPQGDGPFPCAILFHGSEGLDQPYLSTAESLASQGIAVFNFDRFIGNFTSDEDGNSVFFTYTIENQLVLTVEAEVIETVSAIKLIQSHPKIDPAKIGLIGWSRGGNVALECSLQSTLDKVYPTFKPAFCINYYTMPLVQKREHPVAPTLFLHGATDDYTPVSMLAHYLSRLSNTPVTFHSNACEIQEYTNGNGNNLIKTIIYPNAGHAFDEKRNPFLFNHFFGFGEFLEDFFFGLRYEWNDYFNESVKDDMSNAMNLSKCCVEILEDGTGFRSIDNGKTGLWTEFPQFIRDHLTYGVNFEINPRAGIEAEKALISFLKNDVRII